MGRFYYFITNEDGQGLLEYGLILGLIAIVVIAALAILGPPVANLYYINTDINK